MWPSLVIASLLVAAALAGGFWWASRRAVIRLTVDEGKVAAASGEVPEQFTEDVERICQLWGVQSGELIGRKQGRSVRIICKGSDLQRIERALQHAWDHPLD
jgi:hypothetical protein